MENGRTSRSLASLDKLFRAAKSGNEKSIIDLAAVKGLDLNIVGNDGKTPLFHAISGGHKNAAEILLNNGADVQKSSFVSYHMDRRSIQLISCDEPPVVTAARLNNIEILKLLITQGANIDDQSRCYYHMNSSPVKDKTPLHFACENHNVEMVSLLLNNNASVSIEDRQIELPVHIAVRCKACPQLTEILKMLCEHGSNLNTLNKIECPPLYLATFYGCLTKVEMLLFYGSKINSVCERESSYGTALHIAALKDRVPLAELLIRHGAQLSIINAAQSTPLQVNMIAHSKSDIASLLIYHGADLSGYDKYGFSLLANCIRNIRLDCESLARLMVYAGYDLNDEHWLRSPEKQQQLKDDGFFVPVIPVPAGRVASLYKWLQEHQTNSLKLMDLCRISIRRILSENYEGRSIVTALKKLPLPSALRDLVLLIEYM